MPDRKDKPGKEKDVTVIGAGIVGICTALALQEKGFTVRVIDPDPPADGASSGNAGVIASWSCVPQSLPGVWKKVPGWLFDPDGPLAVRWSYTPWLMPWMFRFFGAASPQRLPALADAMLTVNRPSIDLYRHFLGAVENSELVRDSLYLHVYRNPADASLELLPWRLRRERGVPLEVLKNGEIREVEPELSPEFKAAVAVKGQARAVNPGRLGTVLAAKAKARGAEFLRRRVHRLLPGTDGACRLETSQGDLSAARVVLAAGAWSARLLAPLKIKVPLEAERGYHLNFEDPGVSLNNLVLDGERKFVVSSMEMGVRCAGTAEFAGLDTAPNYRRARVFKRLAKRLLPNLNTESISEWMGTRPSTPDTVPFIGPVPGHPNIIAAFGHGHLGLTGAPMTGRMVAALAANEPLNVNMEPYRLDRFN